MATEVVMPRLGWTMEVGQIVQWHKHDGDPVKAGEILFAIEGDKAVTDVEALETGILRVPPDAPEVGVEVPVGTLLAYLVAPGEPAPFKAAQQAATTPADSSQAPASLPADGVTASAPTTRRIDATGTTISPRAHRVAAELGLDWHAVQGTGATGRIVERDVRAAATQQSRQAPPRISPLVRHVAAQAVVDVEQLAAARPGQRVSRADVAAAARTTARIAPAAPGIPLSQVRRVIGARLAESAQTTVPVTLTAEADATELVRLRGQLAVDLAGTAERVPSYTALLVRLTALALVEHAALNSSLREEHLVQHPTVNIGVAVDTERGLLAPVIHDAQTKSVRRIAAEAADLVARTRAGRATPDDLQGATFTISNLGMYDIDAFTPVINLPECAILGVGRIVARPVVIDDVAETVAVRKMLALSLTFDHRVVDGAPAARFLQRLKHFVEHPLLWLTQ
jgi:pyruvate dehydrogenase E2 component (dihydrolipoamide acetyltransferase)